MFLNNLRYVRNSNTTNKFNSNQHLFTCSSSQLHVSTIYGHHQAGHKRENKYTVVFGIEHLMLYISVCIKDIHIKLDSLRNEDGKS